MPVDDAISLEFLQRQQQMVLDEMRRVNVRLDDVHKDYLGIARTFTGMADLYSGTKRRIEELSAELESIFKMEVIGSNAHMTTKLEDRIDTGIETLRAEMNARFEAIDARFAAVDARFDTVDARFDTMDARFDTLEKLIRDLAR